MGEESLVQLLLVEYLGVAIIVGKPPDRIQLERPLRVGRDPPRDGAVDKLEARTWLPARYIIVDETTATRANPFGAIGSPLLFANGHARSSAHARLGVRASAAVVATATAAASQRHAAFEHLVIITKPTQAAFGQEGGKVLLHLLVVVVSH